MLVVKNKKWDYPHSFDQFLTNDFQKLFGADSQYSVPSVNILENPQSFLIELAAPGLQKEDLKLQIEKETLTISSEKKNETNSKNGNYLKKEFSYQTFKRSFNIPQNVDVNSIKASYENGVLVVEIPKKAKEDVETAKTISIS